MTCCWPGDAQTKPRKHSLASQLSGKQYTCCDPGGFHSTEGNATPEPLLQHEHNLERCVLSQLLRGTYVKRRGARCLQVSTEAWLPHARVTYTKLRAYQRQCGNHQLRILLSNHINTTHTPYRRSLACLSVAGLPGLIAGDTR
jgi:hypothetical protein